MTDKSTLEVLLDRWRKAKSQEEGRKVNVAQFFLRAAPNDWDAQRWASHWNNHRVMHPTAEQFLLREVSDDSKRKKATRTGEKDSVRKGKEEA